MLLKLIDGWTQDYWALLLGALVLFIGWRIGTRVIGERPLMDHFPRITAALDILILPLLAIIAGGLLRFANRNFGTELLDAGLLTLTLLAVYLVEAWALARFVEVSLALRSEERRGEQVPRLIIGLIYAALFLLASTLFLWQQGYSFAGVWVSTGVAAAVLGLALQKTLGDLFSGIALGLERPFRIGDWLELSDNTLGQVVDMNWRATHLRGWDNATHVIPNARLAGESIKNLHAENHLYGPWYFVKIPAEIDPRFASALLLDAAMRCESVLKFPNPIVRLADASSVPYSYMVWVHLRGYPLVFRAREELFREIHQGLQEAGIEVAPQVQELRTRRARVVSSELPTIKLALRSLDFAGHLTDAEITLLSANGEYRYFDMGQPLLAEGAVSDAVYVIAGGLVDVAVNLPGGSRKVLETLGPGNHFGITAMLGAEPSYLEYAANTDVTLIRIDIECVRGIVAERPELAEILSRIIKERYDAAEAARGASRLSTRRLTLRDIGLGIERRIRGPGRGASQKPDV